ncbi:unnamed protein product [Angiostrongylus costaricensis]|uniref:DUF2510 domain-containing protein n=1 Tax=Angiostrongylus costaricensis TaxID=334426 RepID=A0A158PII5_ANGCS|nr:unnamed protein product [Angiostrongylus costaricensis]
MRVLWLATFLPLALCQNAADLEFSPYVYSAVKIPFKNSNYAKDWFGSDVALVQHPLLAAAKPLKPGNPVALPTIAPYVVSWRNLDDTRINNENGWNFEKRVDSKVWWPS